MAMPKQGAETIVVPLWAVEFILDNATLADESSAKLDVGWLSPKMQQARNELEAAAAKARTDG